MYKTVGYKWTKKKAAVPSLQPAVLAWVESERISPAACPEFLSSGIIPQLDQAASRPGLLMLH